MGWCGLLGGVLDGSPNGHKRPESKPKVGRGRSSSRSSVSAQGFASEHASLRCWGPQPLNACRLPPEKFVAGSTKCEPLQRNVDRSYYDLGWSGQPRSCFDQARRSTK